MGGAGLGIGGEETEGMKASRTKWNKTEQKALVFQ